MKRRNEQISAELDAYVTAHCTPPDALLRELADETALRYPNDTGLQVGPDHGLLLELLVRSANRRSAVEIGTFTGYSSICIARGLAEGGRLLCCDIDVEATAIARRSWEKAKLTDRIELRLGPALDTLRALPLEPRFDFAFIDADKISYPEYWDEVVPRMVPGGMICVDNTFSHGGVIIEGNDHPFLLAVLQMNDKAVTDDRVDTVMLPVGDGLTLALKR
jgi:caffeoyl-CoA O-methyltransferase